jgi:hypothetical protein
MITEQQLIDLGFEKSEVSGEESGGDPFYYYQIEFGDGLYDKITLISNANDEVINGWEVNVFDMELFKFKDYDLLKKQIDIFKQIFS